MRWGPLSARARLSSQYDKAAPSRAERPIRQPEPSVTSEIAPAARGLVSAAATAIARTNASFPDIRPPSRVWRTR